uniref:Uncharacterized protein n=1 Tax=Cyanothece sp. (strain PCC 7425 / ATCC 29141) TaxID=395961 RepID=B8HUR8_CYAP4
MPEDSQSLLQSAVQHWENTPVAEQYIHQALETDATDLETLVAAYRFYTAKPPEED